MSSWNESEEIYRQALKSGRKYRRQCVQNGTYPFLQVLDEILPEYVTAGEFNLGLIEIPIDKIVGTKTKGRTNAFAANFMPLLPEDSEFSVKWIKLCEAHLSEVGIRDPVSCYEFLGRFYVLEGNKRVSVLKHFGASSVMGNVIRILPGESSSEEILAYREFLEYYPRTKLYEVSFSAVGSFPKFQAALGYDPDHEWTDQDRSRFRSGYYFFEQAFRKLNDGTVRATVADAMLEWLKVYPFESIKMMTGQELLQSLESIWSNVKAIGQYSIIKVDTCSAGADDRSYKNRRVFSLMRSYVNVAFIHELTPDTSEWVKSHESGSDYLENTLGDHVIVQRYFGVGTGNEAERVMEIAIKNGAEVIFATTASLITACRRVAARHPETRILNCSVCMPYADVRTYYGRIYEANFISGAIAGAVSKSDTIGFMAGYPIFGVPAGINAFALGAQLTNPNARVRLVWSCVDGDPLKELIDCGVDAISTLDVPQKDCAGEQWSTFRLRDDDGRELLASAQWDWGAFYVQIARSILSGKWELPIFGRRDNQAVNYWWGMASGAIDVRLTDKVPDGVRVLGEHLMEGIKSGEVDPFRCRIISQDGAVRNDGMKGFTPEEILHMDWLCENVIGTIPEFDALDEKTQALARFQGIYRDRIPPQKEQILL